jgi:hypothetical protein
MATRIVFTGGEALLVEEDVATVVKALENISPSASDLVKVTLDDTSVYVRPSQVAYVAPE